MKRYGKYGAKVSWIVNRFGKYRRNTCSEKIWEKNMEENSGRKVNWIVKWYGKYERFLC